MSQSGRGCRSAISVTTTSAQCSSWAQCTIIYKSTKVTASRKNSWPWSLLILQWGWAAGLGFAWFLLDFFFCWIVLWFVWVFFTFVFDGGLGDSKKRICRAQVSRKSDFIPFISQNCLLCFIGYPHKASLSGTQAATVPSQSQLIRHPGCYFQPYNLPRPCAFFHKELLLQIITKKSLFKNY